MNAALVGFVKDWMNDYDRKKEKASDRKYSEQRRDEERAYERSQEAEQRKYNEGRVLETRKYAEGRSDIEREKALETSAKEREASYRDTLAKFDVAYPAIAQFFPKDMTKEQAFLLVNKNPELSNILQNVTALEGLKSGIPASSVRTTLASNSATESSANKRMAEDVATLPNAGREALAKQRLSIATDTLGGQSPAQAFLNPNQTHYPVINEDGSISIEQNPYHSRVHKDPLAAMVDGNNRLSENLKQQGAFETGTLRYKPMIFGSNMKAPVQTRVSNINFNNQSNNASERPALISSQLQSNPNSIDSIVKEQHGLVTRANANNRTMQEQALIDQVLTDEFKKRIQGYRFGTDTQKLQMP